MSDNSSLPFGKINDVQSLGQCVRAQRKAQNATQAEFAALCGVGQRFISELENGKPTMELGKVLKVLKCLGLDCAVYPRGWQAPQAPNNKARGS